jgi:cell division septum initiation protein DivIVA
LTLQNSSFSSSQDSSAAQSRAASFCGQQQHTSNGHAAAAAAAASTAVGWSVHSPAGGVMPLGPTSRPSPLPMLHESRSWGQNLDAADRVMDVQRRHSMHARPDANSQAQQQQAHKQHAQLIYLLD